VFKALKSSGSTILSIGKSLTLLHPLPESLSATNRSPSLLPFACLVLGVVQDRDANKGYDGVIAIALALKTWAFVVGVGYCFFDCYKLGRVGNMSERARLKREADIVDPESESFRVHQVATLALLIISPFLIFVDDALTARPVSKIVSCIGIAIVCAMAIATLVLLPTSRLLLSALLDSVLIADLRRLFRIVMFGVFLA
jgi:hypothetical protein